MEIPFPELRVRTGTRLTTPEPSLQPQPDFKSSDGRDHPVDWVILVTGTAVMITLSTLPELPVLSSHLSWTLPVVVSCAAPTSVRPSVAVKFPPGSSEAMVLSRKPPRESTRLQVTVS